MKLDQNNPQDPSKKMHTLIRRVFIQIFKQVNPSKSRAGSSRLHSYQDIAETGE